MFSFLSDFFQKNKIECFAPLPLSACRTVRPYLLEREGIGNTGTVMMFAVPYYTAACDDPRRNLSVYAVGRDYHAYFQALFADMLPALRERFPTQRFAGFSDHSPINEVDAAAKAGLGVIGSNHLLLTERYSSYVFLGEVITDMYVACTPHEVAYCQNCGCCMQQCPSAACNGCLSALTQKKGLLTDTERDAIRSHGSAWGCDICQEACPYTARAKQAGTLYSPIPFFAEQAIPCLTTEILEAMSDESFRVRAYSWRGREPIDRNLALLEQPSKGDGVC